MIAYAGGIAAIATASPKTNSEKPPKEPACFVVSMPFTSAARDRLLTPCYLSVKNQAPRVEKAARRAKNLKWSNQITADSSAWRFFELPLRDWALLEVSLLWTWSSDLDSG